MMVIAVLCVLEALLPWPNMIFALNITACWIYSVQKVCDWCLARKGVLTLERHSGILHAKYVFGILQRMLSKTQSCHMFQAGFAHLFQCSDCACHA